MTDSESSGRDGEWEFSLEDIARRQSQAEAAAEAERERTEPLEAGSPSLENVVFVLLGVLFTLYVLSRLVV